jgi:hypothetical protein
MRARMSVVGVVGVLTALLLAIPLSAAPAAAAATCDGHVATKVGTNGNNNLKGTDGPDVLVGRRGFCQVWVTTVSRSLPASEEARDRYLNPRRCMSPRCCP